MMKPMTIRDLDLNQIALSGQCFRMRKTGEDTFGVAAADKYVEIVQKGEEFWFSCEEEEFQNFWSPYFDLETDYSRIKKLVDREDQYLTQAVEFGGGIRILRQDLWEMIITFLVSQNNNVGRIRRSIEALCDALGEARKANGTKYRAFPTPKAIAKAGPEKLGSLGLGYRDKYLARMAEAVAGGEFDLEELKREGYEEAHRRLTGQFGIGKKVADCICLFGLHHIDAFPVDTHIKKILDAHYGSGFPYDRYRGCLGVIQQYLFYYDLHGCAPMAEGR